MLVVVAVVIALAAGVVGTLVALRLLAGTRLDAARRERHLLLAEAKRDAEATRREAAIETRGELLDQRGLAPQHRFGQNFLIDHNLIRKLVDAAGVDERSLVLE